MEWAKARGLRPTEGFGGGCTASLRSWLSMGNILETLDHVTFWRRGGKPAVVASNPYEGRRRDGQYWRADEDRLRAHGYTVIVHPAESCASWHAPDLTVLVEIWLPGVDPSYRIEVGS